MISRRGTGWLNVWLCRISNDKCAGFFCQWKWELRVSVPSIPINPSVLSWSYQLFWRVLILKDIKHLSLNSCYILSLCDNYYWLWLINLNLCPYTYEYSALEIPVESCRHNLRFKTDDKCIWRFLDSSICNMAPDSNLTLNRKVY